MAKYILKRLGQTLIVLFIVSVFAFSLIRLAGGNPALMLVPDGSPQEVIEAMEKELGLDQPLWKQYINYMVGVLHGDLGTSLAYKVPVAKVIGERLPFTAALTAVSVLIGIGLAVPIGIVAGTHRGKPIDFFAMFFALVGNSMSPVWLAVFLVFVFAVRLQWLPAMGAESIKNIILPAITMGYPMAAEVTRVGRSGMIDTMSEDYITATFAKGVSTREVHWKYAFKNAVIPIITMVGMTIGGYMAGAVVVETVFTWSGIGQLLNQAVGNRDYALVQSLLLVSSTIFAIMNLIVDIINSLVDPRVALEG